MQHDKKFQSWISSFLFFLESWFVGWMSDIYIPLKATVTSSYPGLSENLLIFHKLPSVCVCVCVCVCARKEIMHNPVSNKGTSWTSTSASSLSPPVCSHSSTSSPTRDGAPSWYQWNFKYHQRYLMSAWYENISQHLILSPGITCLCVALRIEEI